MKTMKKSGLIAVALVAVALITTVAFVMGCRPEAEGLPDGYETIRVNFGDTNARTVLTDDGFEDITDFAVVGLQFSGSEDKMIWLNKAQLVGIATPPILVKSGSYTIVGTAYRTGSVAAGGGITSNTGGYFEENPTTTPTIPGSISNPAAWGSISGVSVTAATTETLKLYASAAASSHPGMTNSGTFSYTITNSTTTTTEGTIEIVAYSGAGAGTGAMAEDELESQDYPGQHGWEGGPIPLPVGFYTLLFSFDRAGSVVNHTYVLHIYDGMNSKFTFELTDDYFTITSIALTVELEYIPPRDTLLAPIVNAPGAASATGFPNEEAYQISGAATITFTLGGNSGQFTTTTITVDGSAAAFGTAYGRTTSPFAGNGTYQVVVTGIRPPEDPYPGPFTKVIWVKVVD